MATTKPLAPLSSMPVDHALIGRLRASFALLSESRLDLGELFYTRLFAAAPQLRQLFSTDRETQAKKLVAALAAIVANLENAEANRAYIASLGQRHVGYGAKPEHYGLVIDLLVDSMREVLGSRSDERVLDEWRTALRLVSDQMIAAAERPGDNA